MSNNNIPQPDPMPRLRSLDQISIAAQDAYCFLTALANECKQKAIEGGACGLCGGVGYTLDDEDRASLCECEKAKMRQRIYDRAGVPTEYRHFDLSNWHAHQDADGNDLGPQAKKKQWAGAFVARYIKVLPALCSGSYLRLNNTTKTQHVEVKSIILRGGRRSGKKMLAALCVMEAARIGLQAKFYSWIDLNVVLADFDAREEQNRLAEEFARMDVIAIVDIQNYGHKSPTFRLQLDRLISRRNLTGQPTILTVLDSLGKAERAEITADHRRIAQEGRFKSDTPIRSLDPWQDFMSMDSGEVFKAFVRKCFVVELPKSA